MRSVAARLVGMLLLPALLLSTLSSAVPVAAAPPDIDRIVFVDYVAHVHAGTSTDTSCSDSSSYKTLRVKWTSFPVTYSIDVSGVDAVARRKAVVNAVATWDAEQHGGDAGLQFFAEAPSGTTADVTVSWVAIDGPGGTLAQTTVWYNTLTRAIVRATVEFDSGEAWAVLTPPVPICYGAGSTNAFDVGDVATHEIGHVVGLAHPASSARNVPLTMFAYASPGETYKTTLGTGDKKGIAAIYP